MVKANGNCIGIGGEQRSKVNIVAVVIVVLNRDFEVWE
jgi:hypothetical protein